MTHYPRALLAFWILLLGALTTGKAWAQATGLLFLDEGAYQSIPLATPPLFGDLPSSADLSDWFPAPGNQGGQSSCVGWATAYLKAYQENRERTTNSHQFSPAYIYNQIKLGDGCQGGSYFTTALNLVRRDGAALFGDFPYSDQVCHEKPNAALVAKSRQYSIAEWRRVNPQDPVEVKAQIASGFPVLIGMIVDQAFQGMRASTIYNGSGTQRLGGHAMVVLGYDDQKQAFKVINSWGTRWGDSGFGWIGYSAFGNYVREAYASQDIVVAPPPSPSPDPRLVPPPEPAPVAVDATLPIVQHNLPIALPTGGSAPGMLISVPAAVRNGKGRSLQVAAKFFYANGTPLAANIQEISYRDSGGFVASSSPVTIIGTDDERMDRLFVSIPYYAMNFAWTGGITPIQLTLSVSIMVDNEAIRTTEKVPFVLRW